MAKVILQGAPTAKYPESVEVDRSLAVQSKTINDMLEDFGEGAANVLIPVGQQSNDSIALVFEYMDLNERNPPPEKKEGEARSSELQEWEKSFFVNMPMGQLFDFILTSNFLALKPALDASCKTVANLIKGKSPEEIRKTFAIRPEEVRA